MRTNRKLGRAVAGWMVALVFVLGAGAAQALVIYDQDNTRKAIGITDLEIEGAFYDVLFLEQQTAQDVYGDPPGVYTFTTRESARAAVLAVNAALNAEPLIPFWVGEEGGETDESTQVFLVGYGSHIPPIGPRILDAWNGENLFFTEWNDNEPIEVPAYSVDQRTFAVFTVVPEPSTALLMGVSLAVIGILRRRF